MTLMEAFTKLKSTGQKTFQSSDVVALLNIHPSHASTLLRRLSKYGQMVQVKRGLWAFTEGIDFFALASQITAPLPCYISLQTALYHHGMISQIPSVIYCVSLARTKPVETPIGVYSIHHISEDFYFGHESTGSGGARMATPEKALLDFLYFRPAKSRLFAALPEIELPHQFDIAAAQEMLQRISDLRRRTMVKTLFSELFPAA